MSYGEEVLTEIQIEHALQYATVQGQAEKGIWETKDGQKIAVKDMTDSHLRNAINLLKRKNICDLWLPWITRMEEELNSRKTTYIHFGHDSFDKTLGVKKEALDELSHPLRLNNKPPGLWASPKDSKWGWKDWCEQESFRLNTFNKSFTFSLSDDAKILHIHFEDDIYPYLDNVFPDIDSIYAKKLNLSKLMAEYDGIELHMSENKSLYSGFFYGWDCDSICIWNYDCIEADRIKKAKALEEDALER